MVQHINKVNIMSVKKKFYVLEFNCNTCKKGKYDILPYFRDMWRNKRKLFKRDDVKDKKTLSEWIKNVSQYQYWARCEYEFLMASWPFGSYKMNKDINNFLSLNPNFDMSEYPKNIEFINILTQDMSKIDIHEQVMMNIDVITDILYDEFKIGKKKKIRQKNDG